MIGENQKIHFGGPKNRQFFPARGEKGVFLDVLERADHDGVLSKTLYHFFFLDLVQPYIIFCKFFYLTPKHEKDTGNERFSPGDFG